MEITYGRLSGSMLALMEFANMEMPSGIAIRVRRVLSAANKEMDVYNGIVTDNAKKCNGVLKAMEGGKTFYQFANEVAKNEFLASMKEADCVVIDLPGVPLTESDVMEMKTVKASLLTDLDWLVSL